MSIVKTNTAHRGGFDHFEPENSLDANEQRRLRGHLEQIDFTAFAANQTVLRQTPGMWDLESVKRLAVGRPEAPGGGGRAEGARRGRLWPACPQGGARRGAGAPGMARSAPPGRG